MAKTMMKIEKQVRSDRLQVIKDQMKDLIQDAERIVRGTSEESRAKSYWIAHIRMALDDDHTYLGSGSVTMQDTIEMLLDTD